jgi:glycine/D-amino acid oxidase-like deaminating enzyme
VARVLIVGCGCRGRALAAALTEDGHAVRGTTRDRSRIASIEEAGAEGVVADPDRIGTLMPALAGVSVACWLMGSARDGSELHGARLQSLTERLVDTHVRGLVYEKAGTASHTMLEEGAKIVRRASATWRIPVEIVCEDPAQHEPWLASMRTAVGRILEV